LFRRGVPPTSRPADGLGKLLSIHRLKTLYLIEKK
jgi:hypothetical protein